MSALGKRLDVCYVSWVPLYTYVCPRKHEFDRIVPVAKRDDLQPCPETARLWDGSPIRGAVCEELSRRKGIELNANSFPGAAAWRK